MYDAYRRSQNTPGFLLREKDKPASSSGFGVSDNQFEAFNIWSQCGAQAKDSKRIHKNIDLVGEAFDRCYGDISTKVKETTEIVKQAQLRFRSKRKGTSKSIR